MIEHPRHFQLHSADGVGNSAPDSADQNSESALERVPAERIEIGSINYGKLVEPIRKRTDDEMRALKSLSFGRNEPTSDMTGGYVPAGEGFQTTRMTRGMKNAVKMAFTTQLLGRDLGLQGHEIRTPDTGALIMRRFPDDTVIVQRARARPESGEGRSGRKYLQTTSIVLTGQRLSRHASQLTKRFANLRAEPDLINVPESQRKDIDPETISLEAHDIPKLGSLDGGARLIAEYLRSGSEKPFAVPHEQFPSEEIFLEALGKAIEVVSCTDPDWVKDLRVTSGLSGIKLTGRWIHY